MLSIGEQHMARVGVTHIYGAKEKRGGQGRVDEETKRWSSSVSGLKLLSGKWEHVRFDVPLHESQGASSKIMITLRVLCGNY
jgi:hypothetical protein